MFGNDWNLDVDKDGALPLLAMAAANQLAEAEVEAFLSIRFREGCALRHDLDLRMRRCGVAASDVDESLDRLYICDRNHVGVTNVPCGI